MLARASERAREIERRIESESEIEGERGGLGWEEEMNGGGGGGGEGEEMEEDGGGAGRRKERVVLMWGYLPGVSQQRSPLLGPVPVRMPDAAAAAGDAWRDVAGGGCGFAMAVSGDVAFLSRSCASIA